jgi:serine/threonine protein kinase/Tfp pilus assembly protein PilF
MPEPAGKQVAMDLAYEEFCQRLEVGEQLDKDAFCERFPAVKTSLRLLLAAHRVLDENAPEVEEPRPGQPPWPEPGQTFLGFHLLHRLGQGAFGRVYLAAEPALGHRLVAVKVVAQRGTVEAETLGRLRHPNIVPVYSVREDPLTGLTAICMPYLGGATLCDVLDHAFAGRGRPARARVILDAVSEAALPDAPEAGREPPAAVLERGSYLDGVLHVGAQLADALAFIHAQGICHQDLKPSNVLMGRDGRPMLLDFNLSQDEHSQTRLLGGTLPYMAPEQLRAIGSKGKSRLVAPEARSDLFALGVMLYELLAGAHPFGPVSLRLTEQELRRLLLERQRRGPRPLRQINPEVDRTLERLIARCLAYDPNDRPGSAAELADALRRGLTPLRRAQRWVGRRPRTVAAAVLLVLALALGGASLSSPGESPTVPPLKQGQEAFQKGDYRQAVRHFDQALAADPALAEVLFARGQAHLCLAEQDALSLRLALDDFRQLDELTPSGKAKACLAYCLNQMEQHQAAGNWYEQAIRADFAPPAVHNNLGYCYLVGGRLDKACASLGRAVQLDDRLQGAYHNRGLVAYQEAWLLLQRADAASLQVPPPPGPPEAQLRAEMAARLQQGLADLRKAVALGPDSAELYVNAARLCALAGRRDPSLLAPGLGYLIKAVKLGADAGRLTTDRALEPLTQDPTFRALTLEQPAQARAVPASTRLLDPAR